MGGGRQGRHGSGRYPGAEVPARQLTSGYLQGHPEGDPYGQSPMHQHGHLPGHPSGYLHDDGHGHGHGQSHGHGYGAAEPASAGVRRVLAALLLPLLLATVVGAVWLYPFGQDDQDPAPAQGMSTTPVAAEVVAVSEVACGVDPGGVPGGQPGGPGVPPPSVCVTVTVRMTEGEAGGQTVTLPVASGPGAPHYAVGDKVVLAYSGAEPLLGESYEVTDFQRGVPLALLAVLFAGAVLALGRWRGLAALGAMVLSFAVLVVLVLPAILAGENPLLVALVGGGLIMFVVLYLTHGVSARTSTAVVGTLTSLMIIGVLGAGFAAAARLTGMDEDTANLVGILGHDIDTRGLLLAGVVIGALGVLDDITVTQTSAVWEVRRANPALGWRELYAAGQRIGRDHVASVVNTLVMVYTGAALPMLLALSLSGHSLGDVLTAEQVAQEVLRTLVGTIGLVAAVPVTTALAAYVARRQVAPQRRDPTTPASPPMPGRPLTPSGPGARQPR